MRVETLYLMTYDAQKVTFRNIEGEKLFEGISKDIPPCIIQRRISWLEAISDTLYVDLYD